MLGFHYLTTFTLGNGISSVASYPPCFGWCPHLSYSLELIYLIEGMFNNILTRCTDLFLRSSSLLLTHVPYSIFFLRCASMSSLICFTFLSLYFAFRSFVVSVLCYYWLICFPLSMPEPIIYDAQPVAYLLGFLFLCKHVSFPFFNYCYVWLLFLVISFSCM